MEECRLGIVEVKMGFFDRTPLWRDMESWWDRRRFYSAAFGRTFGRTWSRRSLSLLTGSTCKATPNKSMIDLESHSEVIQGITFWRRSKARVRLCICRS